jgi:hypothetical protein
MAATLTTVEHGVVATLATAVDKLRIGRENAGFGTRSFTTGSITTSYVDIYKFTEGTGTNADTFIKFYNSGQYQYYQQGKSIALDGNGFPTNVLNDGGAAAQVLVGTGEINSTTRLGIYATSTAYRSLSFKPTSGSQYGVHIYQKYDSSSASYQTVLGEIFVKPQNRPAAVTANNMALTQFMYFDNYITRYGDTYDGPRWLYPDSPYSFWSGRSPATSGETYDRTALYTRLSRGTTGYLKEDGDSYNGGQTIVGTYSYGCDYFMRSCDPMVYDVWDVSDDGVTYKLARPLTLRHRSRPVGVTPTDFAIGPLLSPGTEMTVSAGEVYTALGGSLFLRTT